MKTVTLLLSVLAVGSGSAETTCTNRRCLANMLISKGFLSQPQYENCTQVIHVPFIEYQTLSVDTKNLHLISRLQALIIWNDPELSWDTSVYQYDEVALPVSTVWTPDLHVINGILTMEHASNDLLVLSDGTVKHNVTINAEINCEINLFNYPFAGDECPVAIQTWSSEGCGTQLKLGHLKMVDSSHGDWQTENVSLENQGEGRNYIKVSLKIKFTNPFITLLLPSILIITADVVSFALPLRGGERNSFKVTLVLSFTVFLNILNDELPGDGQCSPIIRTHFCIILVLMVLSMLVSMILTRLAEDGHLFFYCRFKQSVQKDTGHKEVKDNEESKADISVIQLNDSHESIQVLRKVVAFLEGLDAKEVEIEQRQKFANTLDHIFFWIYFICGSAYSCAMTYVMVEHKCSVNHFHFWY
ncbi:5-hydroxytryptamine receptor 3A-like [Parambassis ranga]|uniref:5-hydroxytryptamine receptor 3A-like n=1 Tax=Parambassis ranga TaxID=210632 RepID=A0A6P7IJL1_9TELE|nr:5-hydroxytryptamine receptor 3A-like [Parambassis ranga]